MMVLAHARAHTSVILEAPRLRSADTSLVFLRSLSHTAKAKSKGWCSKNLNNTRTNKVRGSTQVQQRVD